MNNFGEFFLDFLGPFFDGLVMIFKYLVQGLFNMLNVLNYIDVYNEYKDGITGAGWIMLIFSVLCLLALFGLLVFLIIYIVKRRIKYHKNLSKQENLLEELDSLNNDVLRLKQENEKFLAMADGANGGAEVDENGNVINKLQEGESRFYRLSKVDEDMASYQAVPTNDQISLEDICEQFKNYAASKMKLYYRIELIRLFIASFSTTHLIILQGISGTGKTSLAYAFGQFLDNDSVIAPVQPSWRDRSELFGYFNEFTKRFNETELLAKMYEASYKDIIYIAILDEMNIARVEYYFAEMLSIMEMPSKEEWVIDLVATIWDNDPKKINEGKFKIPDNMFYIGTINNDDSTFMVTDKVYDRAMPIDINDKVDPFEVPDTDKLHLSYTYFQSLFDKAFKEHPVSEENIKKIGEMDKYVIEHFRLSFGNRIVKQLRDFVPAYVACGGSEIDAIDYLIAHKILRKFDQLNLAFIRNEIDGFISYLNKIFGKDNMQECKDYLLRLKRTM